MTDFHAEVLKAQAAQRDAMLLEEALERRGRAVARAWANRPGGMSWRDLRELVNRDLPPSARVSASTLRGDERAYREPMKDAG